MLCYWKFIADNFASLCSFKNTCLKNHASVELFWINSMDIYFWKRRTLYFTLNVYEAEYIFFLPWTVFNSIHTSGEKFQAGSCSHHPIVQTKIICLEPWASFCMHLLPKNQLIAMTVNFARANSADHVFGITLAYELGCTNSDQVLEF